MRPRDRRLVIVAVAAALLGGLGSNEASAQRTRLLEFGPDAIEIPAPRRAVPVTVPAVEPSEKERPWVLTSPSALRLPPPPGEHESARERRALRKLAAGENADALERVRFWDVRSPAQRWREMLVGLIAQTELGNDVARHAAALLESALHDAHLAAWDSKRAYRRLPPSELDARLVPEVAISGAPSYPCEHAVIAGTAAAILGFLFPAEADRLAAAAHEAAWSRVVASAVYPSDVEAGLVLGRAVAALVIDDARSLTRRQVLQDHLRLGRDVLAADALWAERHPLHARLLERGELLAASTGWAHEHDFIE
jgi:PAP2 superfamily